MKINNLAPIIVFAYNRPWHTRQTLEALYDNYLSSQSILYIYIDGPKADASPEEIKLINKVKKIAQDKQWCKEVIIKERKENLGLARSIVDGITKVINFHKKIIVLEDDLITSKYFLKYMNDGLNIYEAFKNVYSINSYMFEIDYNTSFKSFLCPLATSSWGWATWDDRWDQFEHNPRFKTQIQKNKFLRERFNFGNYDYASMLNNDKSWAIKWYYTAFINNGLGLFPTHSLVKNIGFDGSGTNCLDEEYYFTLYNEDVELDACKTINIEFYNKLYMYFADNISRNVSRKSPDFNSLWREFHRKILRMRGKRGK